MTKPDVGRAAAPDGGFDPSRYLALRLDALLRTSAALTDEAAADLAALAGRLRSAADAGRPAATDDVVRAAAVIRGELRAELNAIAAPTNVVAAPPRHGDDAAISLGKLPWPTGDRGERPLGLRSASPAPRPARSGPASESGSGDRQGRQRRPGAWRRDPAPPAVPETTEAVAPQTEESPSHPGSAAASLTPDVEAPPRPNLSSAAPPLQEEEPGPTARPDTSVEAATPSTPTTTTDEVEGTGDSVGRPPSPFPEEPEPGAQAGEQPARRGRFAAWRRDAARHEPASPGRLDPEIGAASSATASVPASPEVRAHPAPAEPTAPAFEDGSLDVSSAAPVADAEPEPSEAAALPAPVALDPGSTSTTPQVRRRRVLPHRFVARRRRPVEGEAPEPPEGAAASLATLPAPPSTAPDSAVAFADAWRVPEAEVEPAPLDLPPPTGPPVIPASDPYLTPEEALLEAAPDAEPAPARPLTPLPWRMLLRPALTGLAVVGVSLMLFVPYALYATRFFQTRSQHTLRAQYRAEAAIRPGDQVAPGPVLADLSIPAIGLHQIVAEGLSSGTLARGPAFVPPLPSSPQPPAIVIAGHRTLYGGHFRHLDALKPGAVVTLGTPQGVVATYTVEASRTVASSGHIDSADGTQRLYLVTASPTYGASSRLVVVARRTDSGASIVAPTPPPVPLPSLAASGSNLALALLMFVVVFMVAFGRRLYASVWSPAVRWVAALVGLGATVVGWQLLLGGLSHLL